MKNLVLKLLVALTLTCVPLPGYCAGDEQPEVPNNDENAAISDEQAFVEALPLGIWSRIYRFLDDADNYSSYKCSLSVWRLAAYLSTAAQKGNAQMIGWALMGAPADIREQYMEQVLRWAVKNEDLGMIKQLLAICADITAEVKVEIFIEAARSGYLGVVEVLAACADITAEAIGEAFIAAAGSGCLEVVELLLARPDITAEIIGQAVTQAAVISDVEMVRLLLEQGQDISAEYIGEAVVHAAYSMDAALIKLLLEAGKDISAEYIGDALMVAAGNGALEVLKLLLQAGADVTMRDYQGRTALDVARQNNHQEVIELLEQAVRQAQQDVLDAEGGVVQPEGAEGANVRNATADDAVPTPMPRPTIGCDLHARGAMLYGVRESYF